MKHTSLDVLIADDEWLIRKSISRFLNRSGFVTETAGDIDSLLSAISLKHPHILFLDYHMPSMDIHYLVHQFHELVENSMVIIMSGDVDLDLSGIEHLVYAVLQKPFTMDDLLMLLSGMIDKS